MGEPEEGPEELYYLKDLNDKQRRFVEEYLKDLNGKQAAIRAGYAVPSAEVTASRLLSQDKLRKAVDAAMNARSVRVNLVQDRVMQELMKVAFSNAADFSRVDDQGTPVLDLSNMTTDQASAISEFSTDTQVLPGDDAGLVVRSRVKFHSKLHALDLLGKHLGAHITNMRVAGVDGGPVKVEEVVTDKQRARAVSLALLRGHKEGDKPEPDAETDEAKDE